MKPIVQEDGFGCGIACVAFVLGIDYGMATTLFKNGAERAKETGFNYKEISKILGQDYNGKYIKPKLRKKIYKEGVIVFIGRSKKYKYGHYLARAEGVWMDPWINFQYEERKAGFRTRLPGRPIYMIYKDPCC